MVIEKEPDRTCFLSAVTAGTSSVLLRDTGWRFGGWAAALDSAQAARGGLLRRGTVRLLLARPGPGEAPAYPDPAELLAALHAEPPPALAVTLWTRGLQALAGTADETDEAEAAEEAAAGIELDVAGRRLPPVTLFTGQVTRQSILMTKFRRLGWQDQIVRCSTRDRCFLSDRE